MLIEMYKKLLDMVAEDDLRLLGEGPRKLLAPCFSPPLQGIEASVVFVSQK